MAGRPPRKSALSAALALFASPQNRDDVLKVAHAVFSTAMVKSALDRTQNSMKKCAKAECFAECLEMIEEEMGESHSPFIPRKQTVLTTPAGMPNGVPTTVIRAQQSQQPTP